MAPPKASSLIALTVVVALLVLVPAPAVAQAQAPVAAPPIDILKILSAFPEFSNFTSMLNQALQGN